MIYLLFIEAIFVGFLVLVFGVLFSAISMGWEETRKFKHWMSILVVMFLLGVTVHLVCELTGLNKWYCKNGYACKSK